MMKMKVKIDGIWEVEIRYTTEGLENGATGGHQPGLVIIHPDYLIGNPWRAIAIREHEFQHEIQRRLVPNFDKKYIANPVPFEKEAHARQIIKLWEESGESLPYDVAVQFAYNLSLYDGISFEEAYEFISHVAETKEYGEVTKEYLRFRTKPY